MYHIQRMLLIVSICKYSRECCARIKSTGGATGII